MSKINKQKKKWTKPDFQSLKFNQTLQGNIGGQGEADYTTFGSEHGTIS